jgi:hypothetical protein
MDTESGKTIHDRKDFHLLYLSHELRESSAAVATGGEAN